MEKPPEKLLEQVSDVIRFKNIDFAQKQLIVRNVKVSKVEKVDSQCYRQAFLYFHHELLIISNTL